MKTSFLHEYLGHVMPLLIVVLAVMALHLDSTPLSIAVLVLSLAALHICRVDYIARRDEMLSERTEMVGRSRTTCMDRVMFELWLILGTSDLRYIPWCGVSGIAGLLLGVVAMLNSLATS